VNRYLLELREPDGHIAEELLYFYDDGAGPVAMDGMPLADGRSLEMYGRRWVVRKAAHYRSHIRVLCVAAGEATA
jgi:hypothetical protein